MQTIGTAFARQFTSAVSHTSDPSAWIGRRKLSKECPLDNQVSRFSPDIVSQAIKNCGNSLVSGPDALTIHHLKNLAPQDFNTSLPFTTSQSTTAILPPSGNTQLLPLFPNCCYGLRKALQPEFNPLSLSPNQHGFRPNNYTVSALLPLAHKIAQSFTQLHPPTLHFDQDNLSYQSF